MKTLVHRFDPEKKVKYRHAKMVWFSSTIIFANMIFPCIIAISMYYSGTSEKDIIESFIKLYLISIGIVFCIATPIIYLAGSTDEDIRIIINQNDIISLYLGISHHVYKMSFTEIDKVKIKRLGMYIYQKGIKYKIKRLIPA